MIKYTIRIRKRFIDSKGWFKNHASNTYFFHGHDAHEFYFTSQRDVRESMSKVIDYINWEMYALLPNGFEPVWHNSYTSIFKAGSGCHVYKANHQVAIYIDVH